MTFKLPKFMWIDYVFLASLAIFIPLAFLVKWKYFMAIMVLYLFGLLLLKTFIKEKK